MPARSGASCGHDKGRHGRVDVRSGEGAWRGERDRQYRRAWLDRDGAQVCRRGNTGRAHLPDTLLGRRGKPEEIAAMVRFLCSSEVRFITGQTSHVNGGAFLS